MPGSSSTWVEAAAQHRALAAEDAAAAARDPQVGPPVAEEPAVRAVGFAIERAVLALVPLALLPW